MNTNTQNFSGINRILMLGFNRFQNFNLFIFLVFLLIYCVTMCGNLLIIMVVSYSGSLHYPMYFLLTQLAFSNILLSTTIIPNMLKVVLYNGSFVSFIGCLVQFYFLTGSVAMECLILTLMSYDRYQAICNPLHYSTVMNLTFCLKVILLFWLMVAVAILMLSVTMSYLYFCGPNIIDHFFCDFDPILELSCSDTFIIKIEDIILGIPLGVAHFPIVIVSYVYIITTILKIPTVTGRQKTFSTCSSHLSVVSVYYLSLFIIYLFPSHRSIKKILSLFYTVLTPLLNPMIYSLSNRDIKQAIKKMMRSLLDNLTH